MKKSLEEYRKGAVGALMDEYERAALELKSLVKTVGVASAGAIAVARGQNPNVRR